MPDSAHMPAYPYFPMLPDAGRRIALQTRHESFACTRC